MLAKISNAAIRFCLVPIKIRMINLAKVRSIILSCGKDPEGGQQRVARRISHKCELLLWSHRPQYRNNTGTFVSFLPYMLRLGRIRPDFGLVLSENVVKIWRTFVLLATLTTLLLGDVYGYMYASNSHTKPDMRRSSIW